MLGKEEERLVEGLRDVWGLKEGEFDDGAEGSVVESSSSFQWIHS